MKNLGKKRKLERMTVNAYGCWCKISCTCNCNCACPCNCNAPYVTVGMSNGQGNGMYIYYLNSLTNTSQTSREKFNGLFLKKFP